MWFQEQFKKWKICEDHWFMAHEEVAKIKCIPSFKSVDKKGKLILVTAMSPTPFGEGKTTTVIGLTDAMNKIGAETIATLRQPSVGPVFGKKGGATGGGKAVVVPKDRIDLGLSGDFYALEAANNMISALIDNHIYHNKEPHLSAQVLWKRCLDMNDRALRSFNAKEGKRGFVITAASELMAILSLSRSFKELKDNIGNITIGFDHNMKLMKASDLNFHKAAAVLLRDAFYPNLVRTSEGNPVIMHAGPFANIAQGTSSILSTQMALNLSDYVVTEAGFGAELGAEKFFNIKCRKADFDIACSVIVATTRAIEAHGIENLLLHIDNLKSFNTNVVVALNKFDSDSTEELNNIKSKLEELGIVCEICDGFAKGSEGAIDLAKSVLESVEVKKVNYTYDLNLSIQEKVETIAKKIYRAGAVEWSLKAKEKLATFACYNDFPVCMAKTPLTIGDDPKEAFMQDKHTVHIRDLKIQSGAGFVIALTGQTMLLPGLPKEPRALDVDLADDGTILWS
jgi:formate--tetrahydrofolate ligase